MDKVAGKLTQVVCRTSANGPSKAISLKASSLAKLADGACTCSLGDTSVLVVAVSEQAQKAAQSFMPLAVDYRQKAAAAGRIPMTHLRRETGISEKEILTGRMIDRSIRPAFPKGFYCDTQIICNLLAVDGKNDADVLAINGASASLAISNIPWNGPVGAVRMGLIGENTVINPTRREQENSRLNLVMSANGFGNLIMMDGHCREPILTVDLIKVIKHGLKECSAIVESIKNLQNSIGKPKRPFEITHMLSDEQKNLMVSVAQDKIQTVLKNHSYDKKSRDEAMREVREGAMDKMKESFPDADINVMNETFSYVVKETYKQVLDETKIRCDGRRFHELRPISCEVDLYKPLHGSAIFQRGQTQVFCSATFDSPDAAYRQDPLAILMGDIKEKNFMLHYEFPNYATNEVKKLTTMPNRREIGHGALAQRGIMPLVPDNNDMTIRLNCEVMESNGSSSMASVCAGSLSLMDAGVDIGEHVAGVAMGLMSDFGSQSTDLKKPPTKSQYHVLTDILGFEDYIGDMDFKVAGTKQAVTALQLDVKPMFGVPASVVYEALQKAQTARVEIISKMAAAISEPRKTKKENHPVIKTIHVPIHKRARFVGMGGANLKKLTAQIGVRVSAYNPDGEQEDIDADEYGDPSNPSSPQRDNFIIFAPNKDAMQEAEEFIKTLLEKENKEPELEYNGIYTATITEVRPNGVMVTLYTNMRPTLLPLSQLDIRTVRHPSALNLEVNQQLQVKYFGRDPATGQMRLSRKSLMMSSIPRVRKAPLE